MNHDLGCAKVILSSSWPTVVNLDFSDLHFIIFYLSILWFNFIFMFILAVSVKNIINSVTYKDLQYGSKSLAFSRTLVWAYDLKYPPLFLFWLEQELAN